MKSSNIPWLVLLVTFICIGTAELLLWKRLDRIQQNMEKEPTVEYVYVPDPNYDELFGDPDGSLNQTEEPLTPVPDNTSNIITYNPSDIDACFDEFINAGDDGHRYVFVGDSRYVAMESLMMSNDILIAQNGQGRYFLSSNMDVIKSYANADTRIIVGLGVNDIAAGTADYVDMLARLKEETEAEVYYMLINPTNDDACAASGYSVNNVDISNFNAKITAELEPYGIKIIDVNTYLWNTGFETFDGLHYTEPTYQRIYKYLKLSVNYGVCE